MRKVNYLIIFKTLLLSAYFNPDLRAQNGQILADSILVSEMNRDYLVYVPEAYDGSEAWPLVLNLHPITFNAGAQIELSQMNPVADTAHFLVAYPNGTALSPDPNVRFWNPFLNPALPDDLSFLDHLIDTLVENFNVDENRVYMTGGDEGAIMTYTYACRRPEKIAAIATVSLVLPDSFVVSGCVPERPIPLLHMHGTADPIAPFEGGIDGAGNLAPPVRKVVGDWLANNGCALDSNVVDFPNINLADSSTVSRIEFSSCNSYLDANQAIRPYEVWFYIVENGGHNYPGGAPLPEMFGNMNRDISASAEIWKFFSRHTLPERKLLDLTVQHNGIDRKYLLYIPEAYNGSEVWPLVFNIHGAGVTRYGQMAESQMNPVADTAHFIIAYPEATFGPLPPIGEAPVWNATGNPNGPDDLGFLDQLLDTISANYAVDLNRVYATGKSQGGVMSYYLACQLPNRVAAVASVSGTPSLESLWGCNPDQHTPVLHIHGTADVIVPFNGGAGAPGEVPTFPSIFEYLETWKGINDCAVDSTTTDLPDLNKPDSSTVTLIQYENCAQIDLGNNMKRTAEVWLYQVNGGGHTWPGGPDEQIPPGFEAVFGNINQDFTASEAIWNFFNRSQLSTSTQVATPSAFQLNVFPNPSSEELNFQFELPRTSNVTLTLYNSLGQTVASLINRSLEQGTQQIHWKRNNGKFPSGIYYYRLQIDNKVIAQPLSFK